MLLTKRLSDLIRTSGSKIDIGMLLMSFYQGALALNSKEKLITYNNNKLFEPSNNFELSAMVFVLVIYASDEDFNKNIYSIFMSFEKIEQKKVFLNSLIYIKKIVNDGKKRTLINQVYNQCLDNFKLPTWNNKSNNNSLRIVIASGFITANINNTHVQMLTNLAKAILLVENNVKIQWIITSDKSNNTIFGDFWSLQNSNKILTFWDGDISPAQGEIFVPSLNKAENYLEQAVEKVQSIKPDIIIMHGSGTEATYFCRLFKAKIPIIYYPSSLDNTPTTYVDGLFYRSLDVVKRLKEKATVTRMQKLILPYFEKKELNQAPICLKSHKETVNFCVAISRNLISNYFRGLNANKLLEFIRLLDSNKNINLIFVGACERDAFNNDDFNRLIKESRIKFTGAVSEKVFDHLISTEVNVLFTLPGVTGGGAAISKGITKGIAAICSNDSDGSQSCHESFMYKDFSGLVQMIELLATDYGKYMECFELNKKCIEMRTSKDSFNDIYQFINQFKGIHNDKCY